MVLVTEESYEYFLDTLTGETSWDKPLDFDGDDLPPIRFGRAETLLPPLPDLHLRETCGLEDVGLV